MKLALKEFIKEFKRFDNKNEVKTLDNIPAISIQNYTKKFKKFVAVEDINMVVSQGSIHGFIGPNGSGKTTIIKTLIGAYIYDNGDIKINMHKAGSVMANSLIGYIPERASFPSHLNCIQYLQTMAEVSGFSTKDAKIKAKQILEELNLMHLSNRNPSNFSSGMQKKILLAQALLNDPMILILDEPAANLDPIARKDLFDTLFLLKSSGKSVLISSHILSELERIVDEVTFIHYGKIIYSGKLDYFNNLKQDVFIKSSDNESLASYLNELGYETVLNLGNELVVKNVKGDSRKTLYHNVSTSDVDVSVYRSSDLMSIYDYLLRENEEVVDDANL